MGSISIELNAEERGGLEVFWKKFKKKKLKSVDDEKSPCYYIKAFHEMRNVRDRWRFSSVGRASALQADGQRFEPVNLHHFFRRLSSIGRAIDL